MRIETEPQDRSEIDFANVVPRLEVLRCLESRHEMWKCLLEEAFSTHSCAVVLDQLQSDWILEGICSTVNEHVTRVLRSILGWVEIGALRPPRRRMSTGRGFQSLSSKCPSQRLTFPFCCDLPRSVVCCSRRSLLDVRNWYNEVFLRRCSFISYREPLTWAKLPLDFPCFARPDLP